MERVLLLASVASMIDQFNMNNIKILKELNYEVHVAANFELGNTSSKQRMTEFKIELDNLGIVYHQIDFSRNILKIGSNFKAYKQIKKVMKDNIYKFIHCHSPIGGVCGRIASKQTNTPVIYTAHGFHFYKGAPKKNWLLYYPVELWMSRYTDLLITINREDYDLAKRSFKSKKTELIPGVGIDTDKISKVDVDKQLKRQQLNIPLESFVILSVGELNKNKNHEVIIKAIGELKNPNLHYIICGQGPLKEEISKLIIETGLRENIHLLGFRKDVTEICRASDVFAFPSFREGLGLAALEAMASGLPLITSNVHGINDYSTEGKTALKCNPDDVVGFQLAIQRLMDNDNLCITLSNNNIAKSKQFDKEVVNKQMKEIYHNLK